MVIIPTLLSVLGVSLISVLVILALHRQPSKSVLMVLLSLSVGTLLGATFLHLLPEAAEDGFGIRTALTVIAGFLTFFLLEKVVHHHHHRQEAVVGHGHAYHLAWLNLAGDAVHNFLDGLVIAGSYLVSIPLGVATTVSVAFHELPQELADYGVLLYSGLSRRKAILFNALGASTAFIGAGVGIALGAIEAFHLMIIPFAAGTFIYIAAASLVPELHKHCNARDDVLHVGMMVLGVALMAALAMLGGH